MAAMGKSAAAIHPALRVDVAAVFMVSIDVADRAFRFELGCRPSGSRWGIILPKLSSVGILSARFRVGRDYGGWSCESNSCRRVDIRFSIFGGRPPSNRPRVLCRAISRIYPSAAW